MIIPFMLLMLLASCQNGQGGRKKTAKSEDFYTQPLHAINRQDSLFKLEMETDDSSVKIVVPTNSSFALPDSSTKAIPHKLGDFNADGREDALIYLGACGSGGCMYGLFLNQSGNSYTLAFLDYLKNIAFRVEDSGFWTIVSSEEIDPYNPSKSQVSIFTFDEYNYQYELDTTYLYFDQATEQ